jgi:protein-tyrosine phosphatase
VQQGAAQNRRAAQPAGFASACVAARGSGRLRGMVKVLFVCMGNICRSPAGEAVFQKLVDEAGLSDRVKVDSAGTLGYHAGEAADERMRRAAHSRGVNITSRARKFRPADFEEFDYILVADDHNMSELDRLATQQWQRGRLQLMMDFARAKDAPREVPDPYYGGPEGFEQVLDLLEDACAGLLEAVRTRLAGGGE